MVTLLQQLVPLALQFLLFAFKLLTIVIDFCHLFASLLLLRVNEAFLFVAGCTIRIELLLRIMNPQLFVGQFFELAFVFRYTARRLFLKSLEFPLEVGGLLEESFPFRLKGLMFNVKGFTFPFELTSLNLDRFAVGFQILFGFFQLQELFGDVVAIGHLFVLFRRRFRRTIVLPILTGSFPSRERSRTETSLSSGIDTFAQFRKGDNRQAIQSQPITDCPVPYSRIGRNYSIGRSDRRQYGLAGFGGAAGSMLRCQRHVHRVDGGISRVGRKRGGTVQAILFVGNDDSPHGRFFDALGLGFVNVRAGHEFDGNVDCRFNLSVARLGFGVIDIDMVQILNAKRAV